MREKILALAIWVDAFVVGCTANEGDLSPSPTRFERPTSRQPRLVQVEPHYTTAPLAPSLFIEGPLRYRGSCTYVIGAMSSYLLLWPVGAFIPVEGPPGIIVEADGGAIAAFDQRYRVTGGPVTRSQARRQLGAQGFSADCPGRLWQVTSVGPPS